MALSIFFISDCDSMAKKMTARDLSFSVWVLQYSFLEEGTCCSDHKMPLVAFGANNDHACLDLDPLKCIMQLAVWKGVFSIYIVFRSPPSL